MLNVDSSNKGVSFEGVRLVRGFRSGAVECVV